VVEGRGAGQSVQAEDEDGPQVGQARDVVAGEGGDRKRRREQADHRQPPPASRVVAEQQGRWEADEQHEGRGDDRCEEGDRAEVREWRKGPGEEPRRADEPNQQHQRLDGNRRQGCERKGHRFRGWHGSPPQRGIAGGSFASGP
jgi:hypothetical protein